MLAASAEMGRPVLTFEASASERQESPQLAGQSRQEVGRPNIWKQPYRALWHGKQRSAHQLSHQVVCWRLHMVLLIHVSHALVKASNVPEIFLASLQGA